MTEGIIAYQEALSGARKLTIAKYVEDIKHAGFLRVALPENVSMAECSIRFTFDDGATWVKWDYTYGHPAAPPADAGKGEGGE